MPGQYNLAGDEAVMEAQEALSRGVPGVILFGIPPSKDARASGAYDPQGIVQEAAAAIKKAAPDCLVIADVCLCEYTDHGHCGVIRDRDVERLSVLHRPAHESGVHDGVPVVGNTHRSGGDHLADGREPLTLLPHRDRTHRVDPRCPRGHTLSKNETHTRRVVHDRVRVRHGTHGGEATGRRRPRPCGNRLLVLASRSVSYTHLTLPTKRIV